jgi:hypothetical protein
VSFFVIIVIIPYLVALAAFLRPYLPESLVREWPWETRRRLAAGPEQPSNTTASAEVGNYPG